MRWTSSALVVLLTAASLGAQGGGGLPASWWDGPYHWFGTTHTFEVVHAALIGKPGPHQGKVVLWRTHTGHGIWLWDPAAPSAVVDANPVATGGPNIGQRDVLDNVFCAGHSWDGDGDLVVAGGDRQNNVPPQCTIPEPNWSYVMDPDKLLDTTQITWQKTADLLVPSSPQLRWGHYYPAVVAMHNKQVIQIGATSAPWRAPGPGGQPMNCGNHPLGNATRKSNWWQVLNKTLLKWEGQNFGQQGDTPWAGLVTNPESFDIYPLTHLLSTGHVFASTILHSGSVGGRTSSSSATLDVNGFPPSQQNPPPSWFVHMSRLRNPSGQLVNLFYPSGILWPITITATGPMSPVDRVLVIGGWDTNKSYNPQTGSPAEVTVSEVQSPLQPTAAWTIPACYGGLNRARIYTNAVILPDLSLLVVGGSGNEFNPYADVTASPPEVPPQPEYTPELLDLVDPSSGWQDVDPHESPRLYHSVAVLLPDARVLCAGGYRIIRDGFPELSHSDAEIYSPPYLQGIGARPTFEVFSSETPTYGEILTLTVSIPGMSGEAAAQDIEFATLIRCASVTHHFDWDQRCLKMEIISRLGDQISLAPLPPRSASHPNPPSGEFIAPPGYYMLFVLRKKPAGGPQYRVPSVAKFIRIQ